jgi:hypothetical protein
MNESKRKRQHLEQLKEEDNSIVGVNREWPFNWGEDQNNSSDISIGNELREMKLQMAALKVVTSKRIQGATFPK